MSNFPFTTMAPARVRRDPLGPSSINTLHTNIETVDRMWGVEHLSSGKHNALEVPWVLGHMVDGSPPTGYLFDTAYGGGTLARPATGRYTTTVAAGVVSTAVDGVTLQFSAMANVTGSPIEAKPHTITVEAVSATSFQFRVRELSSGLGAGNTWADVNRNIDIGIHALPQPLSASLLFSYSFKQRRDFLTEAATDWNSIVKNQGIVRKASLVEHLSTGAHSANRIAKGVVWARWNGAAQVNDASEGVTSVTRLSQGVVEVVMKDNFPSVTTMTCFPEPQPATTSELVITNGEGFATGAGTSTFRFYTYAYSGGNWARADRTFFASMFGVIV